MPKPGGDQYGCRIDQINDQEIVHVSQVKKQLLHYWRVFVWADGWKKDATKYPQREGDKNPPIYGAWLGEWEDEHKANDSCARWMKAVQDESLKEQKEELDGHKP